MKLALLDLVAKWREPHTNTLGLPQMYVNAANAARSLCADELEAALDDPAPEEGCGKPGCPICDPRPSHESAPTDLATWMESRFGPTWKERGEFIYDDVRAAWNARTVRAESAPTPTCIECGSTGPFALSTVCVKCFDKAAATCPTCGSWVHVLTCYDPFHIGTHDDPVVDAQPRCEHNQGAGHPTGPIGARTGWCPGPAPQPPGFDAATERDAALRFLERMGWPSYVTDAIRAMPLDALEKRLEKSAPECTCEFYRVVTSRPDCPAHGKHAFDPACAVCGQGESEHRDIELVGENRAIKLMGPDR